MKQGHHSLTLRLYAALFAAILAGCSEEGDDVFTYDPARSYRIFLEATVTATDQDGNPISVSFGSCTIRDGSAICFNALRGERRGEGVYFVTHSLHMEDHEEVGFRIKVSNPQYREARKDFMVDRKTVLDFAEKGSFRYSGINYAGRMTLSRTWHAVLERR